jgi:hypothetical protein
MGDLLDDLAASRALVVDSSAPVSGRAAAGAAGAEVTGLPATAAPAGGTGARQQEVPPPAALRHTLRAGASRDSRPAGRPVTR